MKYRIEPKLNDGKNEHGPIEVEVKDINVLADIVAENAANDYGEPFGVGFTLTLERIA
jgi:hypothetical protein